MTRGWLVTGTDTAVGKTLISAALIHLLVRGGERVVGMKPIASGGRNSGDGLRSDDAAMLVAAANVNADYKNINPYIFAPAIAPHIAADEVGVRIDLEKVLSHFEILVQASDAIVVEAVGGWRAPLGRGITVEQLAKTLDLPVIMVVGLKLGCISHALLTADAIMASGLTLAGWVANVVDPEMDRVEENVATLRQQLTSPLLGHVPYLNQCDFKAVSGYLTPPP